MSHSAFSQSMSRRADGWHVRPVTAVTPPSAGHGRVQLDSCQRETLCSLGHAALGAGVDAVSGRPAAPTSVRHRRRRRESRSRSGGRAITARSPTMTIGRSMRIGWAAMASNRRSSLGASQPELAVDRLAGAHHLRGGRRCRAGRDRTICRGRRVVEVAAVARRRRPCRRAAPGRCGTSSSGGCSSTVHVSSAMAGDA